MPTRKSDNEAQKVKIGTILNKVVVEKLKERSRLEGKPISNIIEEAVLRYDQTDVLDRNVRLKALQSFRAIRFNLSSEDWRTIMEEDYYEQ